MNLILYAAVKLIAYVAWSALGVEILRSPSLQKDTTLSALPSSILEWKWMPAIGYGFLRLFIGLFFGLLIWLLSSMLLPLFSSLPRGDVLTYFLIYVPIRWIEWTILAMIIARGVRRISWVFLWGDRISRWRLGGIVVSCLADIPIIAFADWTLPVGRFLC